MRQGAAVSAGMVRVRASFGNLVKAPKTAVVDLLLPADRVQRNGFHLYGVGKIRRPRVVEGDVPIFADSHADQVYGVLLQEFLVPGALSGKVGGVSIEVIDVFKRKFFKNPLPQKVPEALRRITRQASVFVHVEAVDPRPVDTGKGNEHLQHLVLLGAAAKITFTSSLRAKSSRSFSPAAVPAAFPIS